jgi:predicted Zn finger-like uncharacterized protein
MIIDCPACHSRFLIPDAALGTIGRQVRCGRCRHQWFQTPESAADAASIPFKPAAEPQKSAETAATAPTAKAAKSDVVDHLSQEPSYHRDDVSMPDSMRDFLPPPEADIPYDHRLLPALRSRQPASWWLRATALSISAIAACLLVLLYAPFIAKHAPWSLPALRVLGVAPADGLVLADVSFEARQENEQYRRFVIDCAVQNTSDTVRALPDLRLQVYNRAGDAIVEERHLLAPIPMIGAKDEVPCDIPAPALRPGTAQTIVLDLGSPLDLRRRARLY